MAATKSMFRLRNSIIIAVAIAAIALLVFMLSLPQLPSDLNAIALRTPTTIYAVTNRSSK
jgi:hypothetical protein